MVSSPRWHITQTNGPIIPRFLKFSHVRIHPYIKSQINRVIFGQSPCPHSLHHLFSLGRLMDPLAKPVASLTLNWPKGLHPPMILYGLSLTSIFRSSKACTETCTYSLGPHPENHSSNHHCLKGLAPTLFSQKSLTFEKPPLSKFA